MFVIILFIIIFISLLFIFLERKGDYIYIKGAKIPSRYWKSIIIIWFGGITGLILGLFLNKIFNRQFPVRISIIIFVFVAFLISNKISK